MRRRLLVADEDTYYGRLYFEPLDAVAQFERLADLGLWVIWQQIVVDQEVEHAALDDDP